MLYLIVVRWPEDSGAIVSHVLHAIIGAEPAVSVFAGRWHLARRVELPQGFAMVPLTPDLYDDIAELAALTRPDPFPGFERLSAGVEAAVREATAAGWLGYIETDYFGGCGTQSAVAWASGRVSAGPFRTERRWDGADFQTTPAGPRAINRVLTLLGVRANGAADEFDALGLGRFRSTEAEDTA